MQALISRARYFPVSLFNVAIGFAGLGLVAQRSLRLWDVSIWFAHVFIAFAIGMFAVITDMYVVKILRHRAEAAAEFKDPTTPCLFSGISIALLLFSIAFLDTHPTVSQTLWAIGAIAQAVLTLLVVTRWLRPVTLEIEQLNALWLMPLVGNMLVPVAGVRHFSPELSWLFFSIGIVFWLVLLMIVFYRMIFRAPMAPRLAPTLAMLVAAPAAGFLGYITLTGGLDPFARVLYYVTLFLALVVALQYPLFRNLKFSATWWALAFPTAVLTLATMRFYELSHWEILKGLSGSLYALLAVMLTVLTVLTVRALQRDELLTLES